MADKKAWVIHLVGDGMSGRLVRYRVLEPGEVMHLTAQVDRESTKETTVMEYNAKINELGRQQMLVATSQPMTKEEREKTAPGAVKWIPLDVGTLAVQWGEFFTTKDTVLLRTIYDKEHNISQGELDAIMSGKVAVLED